MEHLLNFTYTCSLLWLLVVGAILVDLWDRCFTERRLGRKVMSRRLRKTIGKILEYWRLMLIGYVVDLALGVSGWYGLPYLSIVVAVGLMCVEGKSMWEHAVERKSGATGLKEICRAIVECMGEKEAMKVLKQINEYLCQKNLKDS